MEIEVWKYKEKWKTYSMEFLLIDTSHTEVLLNCEKTQICMGHIVILSFLLFLWLVSKYKTCNSHELSYIISWHCQNISSSFFPFNFPFVFWSQNYVFVQIWQSWHGPIDTNSTFEVPTVRFWVCNVGKPWQNMTKTKCY